MFFPFCWLVPSGEWLQSTPHKKAACFLVFSDIYLRKALQVKYSFLTYTVISIFLACYYFLVCLPHLPSMLFYPHLISTVQPILNGTMKAWFLSIKSTLYEKKKNLYFVQ